MLERTALCAGRSAQPASSVTIPVRRSRLRKAPEEPAEISPRGRELGSAIRRCLSSTLESVLEAGRLLTLTKTDLPHGEFSAVVEGEVGISLQTAEKLMAIARHPVLSNPAHARVLPPSWTTLYELTKVPDGELEKALEENRVHAEMSRSQVVKLHAELPASIERQVCPKCGDDTLRRYKSTKVELGEGAILLPRVLERRLYVCVTESCAAGYLSEETLVSAYEKRYIPKVSTANYNPE